MPKASEMKNPKYEWRDIVSVSIVDHYYLNLELTCGHYLKMSRTGYGKHYAGLDHCVSCFECEKQRDIQFNLGAGI